jgi:catechol 2,3-dioxygenase-like lactoylglutathione lyase family enzyme
MDSVPSRPTRLGHVAIRVRDVERSRDFYSRLLGMRISDVNEDGLTFLRCGPDHHSLVLAPARSEDDLPQKDQQAFHHMAWEVPDVQALLRARDFLRAEGVTVYFEGRRGPGDNFGVEFYDPDGYHVELYCDMEQVPWDGQARPAAQWRRTSSLEAAIAEG